MLLGWLLLVSILLHLLLRFLVVIRLRCHRLAESNHHLNRRPLLLSHSPAACAPLVYQSILLQKLDATRFSLGFYAHFRPKAPYVMQQLSTVLASRTTPSRPLSTEPFRGSSCFDNHPPPMVPQGRQRRLRSHRDPLTPPPLLHQSHAAGRLLAQRKIQKQHNNKGKTPPPYLALYFALWGRRWFLASLSSPALGSPLSRLP